MSYTWIEAGPAAAVVNITEAVEEQGFGETEAVVFSTPPSIPVPSWRQRVTETSANVSTPWCLSPLNTMYQLSVWGA